MACSALEGVPVLDTLNDRRLQIALKKVRELCTGELSGPDCAWECEADSDYREWIGEMAAEAERLVETLWDKTVPE